MDRISKTARSRNMTQIRSRGSRTTEKRMRALLVSRKFRGWRMHPKILGSPDFAFFAERVLVFTDGCFWHGCPVCGHVPKSHRMYWKPKIERTVARDRLYSRSLRSQGWAVFRVWEHELSASADDVLERLRRVLKKRSQSLRGKRVSDLTC